MTRSKPKVQELKRLIDSRTARQFSFRIHPIPLFQASVETQTRQRVLIPLCMQMLSFAKNDYPKRSPSSSNLVSLWKSHI